MSNDVWKLGCIFTELITYLVREGVAGIHAFRDPIATIIDEIDSNSMSDNRFDDGGEVKPQVQHWIENVASENWKAAQVKLLSRKMLSGSGQRPKAHHIFSSLLKMSLSCYGISYNDGFDMMKMIPAEYAPKPSSFDRPRLRIENWLGRRVYWSPFPPIVDESNSSQAIVA
ncbi:hypothetical protein O1611_g7430 [Lasiodiplodia mahajangana]|uniref:Uncharacterized protein n=1 Tax=Lasiodiplodia mahajangana TaxID=1108764 RepID=A0ACC2JG52_9PEZI|nr:hypothetical protein O1611_g7430 [Lasiodiplodia mahajangana]